jgi:hypothetical protein
MVECHIAYLVSLKCEEINHNSNFRLYQHMSLLCTSCGENKAVRTCGGLKRGARAGFFYSTQRTAMSQRISFYKVHYITAHVNLHFPMLCIWSVDGNSMVHLWPSTAINGPVAKFNIFFKQLSKI